MSSPDHDNASPLDDGAPDGADAVYGVDDHAEAPQKASILRRIWHVVRRPTPTQTERARRSEQHFWLRVVVLLSFFGGVAALGILRVKQTTKGVRTAYELVKTTEELRVQIEENRRLEARLTGLKNPNDLRKEAAEHFDMRAPAASDQEEID
ncbi:MAG: hypothetical protein HY902_13155 [Deltaproteobacteria bacterium]|nr:hypothetical protein [Deltaproteobacteria bacterium]